MNGYTHWNGGMDTGTGTRATRETVHAFKVLPMVLMVFTDGTYLSIYLPIRLNPIRRHQTGSGEPSAGG